MTGDEENVDVTELIENKEYSPLICNEELIALKKKEPPLITDKIRNQLKLDYEKEFKDSLMFRELKYEYSYIIIVEPVHVFSFKSDNTQIKLFFRIDNKYKYINGILKESGWIESDCTK